MRGLGDEGAQLELAAGFQKFLGTLSRTVAHGRELMKLPTSCHADRLVAVRMMTTQQLAALNAANCEVVFDNLTRQLYATDASPYQVVPMAVAFPRNVTHASSIIQAAAQAGVAVIPRGAGTGLFGGAIGQGLGVGFSRHNPENLGFNK